MQASVLVAALLLVTALHSLVIKEYHFVPVPETWEAAHLHCTENYTHLAYVDSPIDMQDLLRAAEGEEFQFAWIGLHRDPFNLTGWKWTGRPGAVTYTNWLHGEPNDLSNTELKTVVHKLGLWLDFDVSEVLPFFCVRVFMVQETEKTWEEALQHCRGAGSDLASLHGPATNPTGHRMWVGLRFLAGRWLWVSGHPLEYRGWADGAGPQCPAATARCGALDKEGLWEARDCLERRSFLCEGGQ